ncbi:MAG: hypothetical protein KatS3mg105_2569 [Gemmatales bacterium]|nr:MAG: hypothetical protein KatS3mg105_2569 [Gemmatales bacterium]
MTSPGGRLDFHQLVDDHYAALYRYAYRLSGSTADAEDLTQETFYQAQCKADQIRDPGAAKAWLFRILRNAYLYRLRSEKQQRLVSLDGLGDMVTAIEPLPTFDSGQLQEALNELPEEFRTAVILYYFEEFSYRDIAEQLGVPIGTVMSRLARAKRFLRKRLSSATSSHDRRTSDGL